MDPKKIEIDYERIDVAGIMDQIKEQTASEDRKAPDASRTKPPAAKDRDPAAGPGRIRQVLLRLMSPLRPFIKLLVLPLDEEYRRTVLVLDHANRRLDRLEKELERVDRLQEYTKLLHHLCHNLVIEMSKLKIEEETLKTKSRILEKDFEFLGKREKALEKEVFK
jgi:hypothetical protein